MSGSGNGNGNGNGDSHEPTPLEEVARRLRAKEAELESDPLYAWKTIPPESVNLVQLHSGLRSVSQIAEAAIDLGIHVSSDVRQVVEILPVLEQTVAQLRILNDEIRSVQATVTSTRREIQFLRDDVREMQERVQMIPAIKSMLADVLVRLPEP